MNKLTLRAVISSILILVVIFLAFTGSLLFFGKTGVVFGIARGALRNIHFWVAVSMCLLAAIHLFLNRKQYLAGLRRGKRKEEIK